MMLVKKLMLLALMIALAGCELSQLPQRQTLTPLPANTVTATLAPSFTPSATLTPLLATDTPTVTPGPPTYTPTVTPTPNPYATYVIQQGDTLLYIIQQPPFYYRTLTQGMVDEILKLNPLMSSIDHLPGAGSSILLPLPSATVTPQGGDLTSTAQSQPNVPQSFNVANAQIIQVTVQDGDTIVGIAESNATTLSIVATLNPQLNFYQCDFTNPSGGPDCNVSLKIGDKINVPALTPTPSLSPTISGSETPTPTPTYSAPTLIFPPQDGNAPARTFQLEWLSAGVLKGKEAYLVEIKDDTSGANVYRDVTTSTSYDLPDSLVPSDGKTHTMEWRVSVVAQNAQGVYDPIGAVGSWRTFQWQSK